MNQPIPIFEGPVAILDMLGFEEFVRRNSLNDVISSYAHILTSAAFTAEVVREDLEFMVYSDTIAVRLVNVCDAGFLNFIQALQLIAHQYFYKNQVPGFLTLPIRGAIAFGKYSWHNGSISTHVLNRPSIVAKSVNFIVGEAIIHAHNDEKSQDWIGISIDHQTAKILELNFPSAFMQLVARSYLIQYDIPRKGGVTPGYVINPTSRATFVRELDAFLATCEEALTGQAISSTVRRKLNNTLSFFYYIICEDALIPRMPRGEVSNIGEIDHARLSDVMHRLEVSLASI
jgi:hypothetical protein